MNAQCTHTHESPQTYSFSCTTHSLPHSRSASLCPCYADACLPFTAALPAAGRELKANNWSGQLHPKYFRYLVHGFEEGPMRDVTMMTGVDLSTPISCTSPAPSP